jgi:FtsH-binding integral membrane protein
VVRWKIVVRDVILIFILTGVGGFLIGLAATASGGGAPMPVIAASNIALSILGFAISGALTRSDRIRHLLMVALLVWILSLVNLLLGFSLVQWLLGGPAILFACVVGGGIAALLFRPQTVGDAA